MRIFLICLCMAAAVVAQDPFGQQKELDIKPVDKNSSQSNFFGSLLIRTDSETDTLPVYLNGQKVGVTPFKANRVPVGKYIISFMSPGLRDSLLGGKIRTLAELPPEIRNIFREQEVTDDVVCGTLSQFSIQTSVIQQEENKEVVFSLEDIRTGFQVSKKNFYAKVGLGAGLIITTGLVIIFALK